MVLKSTRGVGRALLVGLAAVIATLLISSSAFAQSDTNPQWDVFLGYQWIHPGANVPASYGNPNSPGVYTVPDMPAGFGAALAYNFDPHWAGEFDFGHNWGHGNAESTFSVGPRFMFRGESEDFFIHALVGDNWLPVSGLQKGSNGIGLVLGGGMDLTINKSISWRLFQVDYVWSPHNYAAYVDPQFPSLRRPQFQGVRLRTGIVFTFGGAEPVAPTAVCSIQPSEVLVGEPLTATVTPSNFNPKHTVTYSWSGNGGGQLTGKDTTASIDTTNATPGSYGVTAHVTDPKAKKNNEASCTANYTIKPLPPKNPPTVSLSASPSDLVTGGTVNLSANCTSPDGVPVSVANWTSTAGSISGSGTSATLSTTGVPPGPVTVNATCTDSRGLTAQGSTQVTIEAPPVDKKLEMRLALHSVYFIVNQPRPNDKTGGLLPSQQQTLIALATDFKKYLETKPDAQLILGGHADHRGTAEYNMALSRRRVDGVKNFLVQQGVPEASIQVKAFGEDENLTTEQVTEAVNANPDLSSEERARILKNMNVVRMASNRRVDVTLSTTGQSSAKVFPFNSTDALTLIGGREGAKKPAAKKPAPKQ